jgi:hypothetical protein
MVKESKKSYLKYLFIPRQFPQYGLQEGNFLQIVLSMKCSKPQPAKVAFEEWLKEMLQFAAKR